jgi:hypothetical protein
LLPKNWAEAGFRLRMGWVCGATHMGGGSSPNWSILDINAENDVQLFCLPEGD